MVAIRSAFAGMFRRPGRAGSCRWFAALWVVLLLVLGVQPIAAQVGVPNGGMVPLGKGCPVNPEACEDLPPGVDVYPDGGTTSDRPWNSTGQTVAFEVHNRGPASQYYQLTCTVLAPLTSCSVPSPVLIAANTQNTYTATFSTGSSGGIGRLTIRAVGQAYGDADSGYVTVKVLSYGVSVTPTSGSTSRPGSTTGLSESFTITNTGTAANTYSITRACSNLTCGTPSVTSLPLAAGASSAVTVPYSTPASGSGWVQLTATGANAPASSGTYTVFVQAYGVAVTPDGGVGAMRPENSTGQTEQFTVRNAGDLSTTYALSCTQTVGLSGCTVSPASLTLGAHDSEVVTVTFAVGSASAATSGTLTLYADAAKATDQGTITIPIGRYGVAVTPDNGTRPDSFPINRSYYTQDFVVKNTGTIGATYLLSCTEAGSVYCAPTAPVSPGSITLAPGDSAIAQARFGTGATKGTGTLAIRASISGVTGTEDSGSYMLRVWDDRPAAGRIVAHTFHAATVPPESGPYSYTVTLENQGGLTGDFTVSCSGGGTQVQCTGTPVSVRLAGGESTQFSFGYTVGGIGAFAPQLRVTLDGDDLPNQPAHDSMSLAITVSGASIIQHLSPVSGGEYTSAVGLRTVLSHPTAAIDPSSVRVYIDGKDNTSKIDTLSASGYVWRPVLADGRRVWKTTACTTTARCDTLTTIVQSIAASSYVLDDSLPSRTVGGYGSDLLLGPLNPPEMGFRGCAESEGNPEIKLSWPTSYLDQSAPAGRVFVATIDTAHVLHVRTQTLPWIVGKSRTCGGLTLLGRGSYNYSMFSTRSPDDPLWSVYPYLAFLGGEVDPDEFPDEALEYALASGPRAIGVAADLPFRRLRRSVLAGVLRAGRLPESPVSWRQFTRGMPAARRMARLLPSAEGIDQHSLQLTLNGTLIVDASTSQVAGVTVKSLDWLVQEVDIDAGIPQYHTVQSGGWNELIASIADTLGRRSSIRTQFVSQPPLAITGPVDSATLTRLRDFEHHDAGDCAAFGAFQCDGVMLTQAIPGFVTRDKDRSLHLVYRSTSQRQPTLLPIEYKILKTQKAPDSIRVVPAVGGAEQTRVTRFAALKGGPGAGAGYVPFSEDRDEDRVLGAELEPLGAGNAHLRSVTTLVKSYYAGLTDPQVDTLVQEVVQLYLSDTTATRFGQGWQLAELGRLVLYNEYGPLMSRGAPAAIWLSGDGSYSIYRKLGGTWTSPAGETARLREVVPATDSGAQYVLDLDNGASVGFGATGWQIWTRDLVGNRTLFQYDTLSNRLNAIQDPTGKRFRFLYHADGALNGLVRAIQVQRSASPTDTVTTALLQYETTTGVGAARLSAVQLPVSETSTSQTTFAYRSDSRFGAFVDSIVDPRSTPTRPVVTKFAYDTTLFTPESVRRPKGSQGTQTANIRFPARRALPRRGFGRLGDEKPERMPLLTQWIGIYTPFAGTPTDFKVDPFGGPTYVRNIAMDPTAVGSNSDDMRHIERDSLGRVARIVRNRYAPSTADSVIYHYDALGRVDTIRRSTLKYPVAPSDSMDVLTFTYDSVSVEQGKAWCSRLKSARDAMGGVTTVVYGAASGPAACLPQKTIGLAADTTIFTYGALAAGDPAGARPIKVRDPNTLAEATTYDPVTWNSRTHTRLADTAVTTAFYDGLGRVDSVFDAAGTRTAYVRDRLGRVLYQKTGTGLLAPTTRTFYDAGGLTDSVQVYASDDEVGDESDGLRRPNGPVQTTRYFFDGLAQQDSIVRPGSRSVQADGFQARKQSWALRDGFGNPTYEYPGNGSYVTRLYDWAGRVTRQENSQVRPGLASSWSTERFADAATVNWWNTFQLGMGRAQSTGQVHTYTYDNKGLVRTASSRDNFLPDTAYVFHEYGYSRTGALVSDVVSFMRGPSVVRRYEYNRRGQRTAAYDTVFVSGTLKGGESAGKLAYVYDNTTGRLTSITGSTNAGDYASATWTYDRGGRTLERRVQLAGAPIGNTLLTSYHYDAAGRQDSVTVRNAGAWPAKTWYEMRRARYNKVDDLTDYETTEPSLDAGAHLNSYSTDGTRRLIGAATGNAWHTWDYDVFGNRTAEVFGATRDATDNPCQGAKTFAYDADSRIRSRVTTAFGFTCNRPSRYWHDQAGNRLGESDTSVTTFEGLKSVSTYTAAGQLYFSVTPTGDAGWWDFNWHWYDAQGRRAISVLGARNAFLPVPDPDSLPGAKRVYYIYDGNDVAMDLVRDGTQWQVDHRYIVGGIDQVLAGRFWMGSQAKNIALVSDRGGTPLTALNVSGDIENNAVYFRRDNFGRLINATGSGGQPLSGTGFAGAGTPNAGGGFVYMRNRWYDPQTGRFLSQDPIGLAGGVNLYAYAGNNPATFADPFGLDTVNVQGAAAQADYQKGKDDLAACAFSTFGGGGKCNKQEAADALRGYTAILAAEISPEVINIEYGPVQGAVSIQPVGTSTRNIRLNPSDAAFGVTYTLPSALMHETYEASSALHQGNPSPKDTGLWRPMHADAVRYAEDPALRGAGMRTRTSRSNGNVYGRPSPF